MPLVSWRLASCNACQIAGRAWSAGGCCAAWVAALAVRCVTDDYRKTARRLVTAVSSGPRPDGLDNM